MGKCDRCKKKSEKYDCAECKPDYKITNADRIRSMLDEELAEFIIKVRDCCSTNYCEGCPFGKNGCSKNKICEWLQSEAE